MKKVTLTTEGAGFSLDPKLFGSFVEHIENCIGGGIVDAGNPLSDEKGIRQDVLALCRELSPSILRFPGGTVMGIYHWQDYVGPVESRKKVKNIVWGGMMTREFGTAEFVEYCRALGAEPMLCINMPTGTPEEAAHWVEYCNGTEDTHYANLRRSHGYAEPFNVKYWCIGNESYSTLDLGMQDRVEDYIRQGWEYTKYMKMTDPNIELVYVGNDEAWNRAVLKAFAPVCDYLSLHVYVGSKTAAEQTEAFVQSTLLPAEKLVEEYSRVSPELHMWYRHPGRSHDIKIAVDEWNIWDCVPGEKSKYGLSMQYCFRDALWTAQFLLLLMRHGKHIGIANLAQMVNVIAPIMAEKEGSYRQPNFYAFSLLAQNCGDIYIPCSVSDLTVSAGLTKKGERLILFAVNRDGEEKELLLPFAAQRITLLTAANIEATATPTFDPVQRKTEKAVGNSVCLPANSIACIFG